MGYYRGRCLAAGSAVAVLLTGSQDARAAASPPAATADGKQIEDIVVTANKRSEKINKVGVTISAFSSKTLAEQRITRPADLASIVPGLSLAPSVHDTPIYTLRGIGYNADALGVFPAVSVYLDQAPLPFPVLGSHTLYDLARIEVLKGPQGTLFGENSTGGAINYIAAKPTPAPSAGINIAYGRFNQVQTTGFVSGPLADGLTARLSFDALRQDGYQNSTTRDDANGTKRYAAGRLLVDWQANDALHITLNANGSVDTSQPPASQLIAVLPTVPSAPSYGELHAPLSPSDPTGADWSVGNGRPHGDRNLLQASLRADYDATDWLQLTSLTTYDGLHQSLTSDEDGSAYQLVDLGEDRGDIASFNQELRLSNANQSGARFRWVLGGNYEQDRVIESDVINYGDNSLSDASNLFIDSSALHTNEHFKSYAAFGNAEYDLLPRLTVLGGVRYTDTSNQTTICDTTGNDGRVAELFQILGTVLGGKTIPLGPQSCIALNQQELPGQRFDDTLAQNNVSWRGGVNYRLTDTTLLYTAISRGFKAGSFPVLSASVFSQLQPVSQESVTSYEAGVKSDIIPNLLHVNAAGFYESYSDKQIEGNVLDPLFGLLQKLANIPKSHIAGGEAEVTFHPTPALSFSAAVTYLDSAVDRYMGIDVFGTEKDFQGDALPFTPKWSGGGERGIRQATERRRHGPAVLRRRCQRAHEVGRLCRRQQHPVPGCGERPFGQPNPVRH